METSSSIKAISAALLTFSIKVDKIKKNTENPYFKSKYAALPDILDAISIPLQESGLILTQHPDGDGLTTMLIHAESGEFFKSTGIMHPTKSDPQAIGSAITYQRRYSIGSILNLNIDEDDDGNKASEPVIRKSDSEQNNKFKDDVRPWLSEEQYKKALDRIKSGEQGVYEKVNELFKMKKEFRAVLSASTKLNSIDNSLELEVIENDPGF